MTPIAASSKWPPVTSLPEWDSTRSYQAQQQRAEELAELDRAKTTFFSSVSHEFRTPLTLILGPVNELLGQTTGVDERARQELELVQRNGLRLTQAGQHPARFLPHPGRANAGAFRAGRPVGRHRRTRQHLPLGDRPGRPDLHRGLSAARSAGPSRPRDVGEGRTQPAFQRVEVHLRGLDHRPGRSRRCECDCDRYRYRNRNTRAGDAAALRTFPSHRDTRRPGLPKAAESGWLSSKNWSACTPARSLPTAGKARARRSRCGCRSTLRICPADDRSPAPAPHATPGVIADPYVQEALRWLPSDTGIARPGCRPPPPAVIPAEGDGERARVLIADDNADMREYLTNLLRNSGYHVGEVVDGEEALKAIRATGSRPGHQRRHDARHGRPATGGRAA